MCNVMFRILEWIFSSDDGDFRFVNGLKSVRARGFDGFEQDFTATGAHYFGGDGFSLGAFVADFEDRFFWTES